MKIWRTSAAASTPPARPQSLLRMMIVGRPHLASSRSSLNRFTAPALPDLPSEAGKRCAITLVFQISTRCNLHCDYCNVDAGPYGQRPTLHPKVIESTLAEFAALAPPEIGIQLHGGEPLIVDPPVELYAAVAQNIMGKFPGTPLTDIGIQSNGTTLDEKRLANLERHGVR